MFMIKDCYLFGLMMKNVTIAAKKYETKWI